MPPISYSVLFYGITEAWVLIVQSHMLLLWYILVVGKLKKRHSACLSKLLISRTKCLTLTLLCLCARILLSTQWPCYILDNSGIRIQFLARLTNSFLSKDCHAKEQPHPVSYSILRADHPSGGKETWQWRWPLTSTSCRCEECMQPHLFSAIHLHNVMFY